MSKVKLTITIEKSVVTRAREAARRNQQSLSEMIERFLTSTYLTKEDFNLQEPTTARQLRGAAKSALLGKTDKEIRAEMHKEKYGL